LSNDAFFKVYPENILGVEKERKGRFGMEKYVEEFTPEQEQAINEAAEVNEPEAAQEVADGIKEDIERGAITKPEVLEKTWSKEVNPSEPKAPAAKTPRFAKAKTAVNKATITSPKKTKGILDLATYSKKQDGVEAKPTPKLKRPAK